MIVGDKGLPPSPTITAMSSDAPLAAGLQAHGSLPMMPRLPVRRLRLIAEIGLFYLCLPLLYAHLIQTWRISLIVLMQPLLLALLAYLLWSRDFSLKREFSRGVSWRVAAGIVGLFVLVAGAISAWVWTNMPGSFLSFPLYNTRMWLLVMIFYPLLSVLPQELAFRSFFFHRYGPLFGDRLWLLAAVNGALFGFAHIIYGGPVSIILSGVLGVLLAWRYAQTRSLRAIWLEHALYGQMIFTVGLGRYFFTGVSTL